MLQKFLISKTSTQKFIIKMIISLALSFITFALLLCLFSLVILRFDTPQSVLIPITTALLTFASFIDSFLLARIFKENGLLIGVGISFVFMMIFIVSAILSSSFALTNLFYTKLIAIFLAGTLGGLIGVSL